MNKAARMVALSGMAAAILVSCGTAGKSGKNGDRAVSGKEETENTEDDFLTLTDSQRELLAKNNTFALNLFNKVSGMDSKVISPLCVSGLMSMLANGADGTTRQEILNTLGWSGASIDDINALYGQIISKAGTLDPSTTVSIADYIAVNKNNRLKDEYARAVSDWYKAEIENLDFTSQRSVGVINGWCSKHTDGMIPQMIDRVEPSAVAYLMNAIYFNGSWTDKFDAKNTKTERFQGYTRDIKKVRMMHRTDEYLYTSNKTYSAVRLPYGNGTFAMTVLLPNGDKSISEMMKVVNAKEIASLGRTMESCEVDLKLPKFTTEVELPLNDAVSSLGAPSMFGSSADFSKLADGDVFVSKMFQKAKIEVSEEGTKAAAVTAAVMMLSAFHPEEPRRVTFHANRPFVYTITESSTGAILFVGQFTGSEL